jgi:arylsulfatase A-like enzyme
MPKGDRSQRWTELLSEHGVHTVHAVGLRGLSARNGVGRAFDVEHATRSNYPLAEDLADVVLHELDELDEKPGFIYAHFVDPHAPYDRGKRAGSAFERYLSEVAVVDRELGRIAEKLEQPSLRERAVLIVSADHGEAFGEHGRTAHASTVYDELLRVPLLISGPGLEARTIATPVSLVDIGPTILDFFGLPTPGSFMGESLAPLLAGRPASLTRPIVADAGRRIQAMVFPDGTKAILDLQRRTTEVYDIEHDPGELDNCASSPNFPAQRYTDALRHFFDVHTLKRRGWEPPRRKF